MCLYASWTAARDVKWQSRSTPSPTKRLPSRKYPEGRRNNAFTPLISLTALFSLLSPSLLLLLFLSESNYLTQYPVFCLFHQLSLSLTFSHFFFLLSGWFLTFLLSMGHAGKQQEREKNAFMLCYCPSPLPFFSLSPHAPLWCVFLDGNQLFPGCKNISNSETSQRWRQSQIAGFCFC